jgi:hypothetical protein
MRAKTARSLSSPSGKNIILRFSRKYSQHYNRRHSRRFDDMVEMKDDYSSGIASFRETANIRFRYAAPDRQDYQALTNVSDQ